MLFLNGFIIICILWEFDILVAWRTLVVVLDFSLFRSTRVTNHSKIFVKCPQYIDIKFDKIRKTYHNSIGFIARKIEGGTLENIKSI